MKLCLPPPGDPPPFKIAYWDESGDLGISARYLAVAGGTKRRRIQTDTLIEGQPTSSPEDANEEEVVDVTTLQTPPSLPSYIEGLDPGLGDYNERELALESWMGEIRGRIEAGPLIRRRTEDDVWSENFGPAKMSRGLNWFYLDRLCRRDAATTLQSYRSPSHKALLRSGLNAQPIPSEFAHEISAKARLDVSPDQETLCLSVHPNSWR